MNHPPRDPDDGTAVAADAIAALECFGGSVDRYQAANLLNMWARQRELTPADWAAVLDHFGSTR